MGYGLIRLMLKSTVLGVGTARTKGANSAWGRGAWKCLELSLCGQIVAFIPLKVDPFADEFHEGMVWSGIGEKYGESMSQGNGNDEFGR